MKNQTPDVWQSVKTSEFCLSLFVVFTISLIANLGDRWVPILDSTNLMFHESGHKILGIFSNRLEVYGGTLMQLFFPVLFSFKFWQEKKTTSFVWSLFWLFQNLWNIDRYLSDARMQALPLVGGGIHDWNEILTRWGILHLDKNIGTTVRCLSAYFLAVTLQWYWKQLKASQNSQK